MIYNEKWLQHLRESSLSKLDKIDLKDLQEYYVGQANKIYKQKLVESKSSKKTEYINKTYEDLKKLMGIKKGGLKAKSSISRKQLETNIQVLRAYVGKESGATLTEKQANISKDLDKAYNTFKKNDLYSDYNWTKDQFAEYISILNDLSDRLPNFGSDDVAPIADLYIQQNDYNKKKFLDYVARVSNQMQGQGNSPYLVTEQILKNWIP